MRDRARSTLLATALAIAVAALVVLLWVRGSDGGVRNALSQRDAALVPARTEERRLPQSRPPAISAATEPAQPGPPASQPAILARNWAGSFSVGGKSSEEIERLFARLPLHDGGWPVEMGPPESVGWTNLYSYEPFRIPALIDRHLDAYYATMVGPQRRNPDATDPMIDQWPDFRPWLREAIATYATLLRRQTGANNAANEAERSHLMTPEQVRALRDDADHAGRWASMIATEVNKQERTFLRARN